MWACIGIGDRQMLVTQQATDEFASFVADLTARAGSAEVVYVAKEGAGEVQAAWSPKEALAYHVIQSGGQGVAPDGRWFTTAAKFGTVKYEGGGDPNPTDCVVSSFPGQALWDLAQRPEWISSCERTPEGGFIVSWVGPGGSRSTKAQLGLPPDVNYPDRTVTLTVSPEGNVLRRHHAAVDPHPAETWEYTYRPEMKGLLAAPEESRGFELKSYRIEATTDTSAFEPSRIEALAVASSMSVAKKLGEASGAMGSSSGAAGASGSNASPRTPIGDTISIPLLGTGVLLIFIAVLAYFKRRGQA